MGWADRNLVHDITVWSATPDGFGGYEFSEPRHIKGRWNHKSERTTDAEGNEIVTNAEVMISKEVEVGDYLHYGVSDVVDPTTVRAYTVKDYRETTDLRNVEVVRKAIV